MLNPEFTHPTLRDQFQRIQEYQNERYKHRKTSKSVDMPNGGVNHVCSLNHRLSEDDLGLKTTTKELEAVVVRGPATACGETLEDTRELDFLHKQVEQLQLENAQLRTSLKGKEHDLSELQRTREEEKVALGGGLSATQRIVELSKKNREMTAELTAEKNRVRQLQRKLKEAEATEKPASEPGKRTSVAAHQKELQSGATSRSECGCELTVAQLQEQLLQAKQKGADYRNQCQLLKQDLKVAHKVLVKEIGEGVSVSALLSGVSGWRGRAQQIILLQNKVAELKQQLERLQSVNGGRQAATSGGEADVRQKATIHKIETERRRNLEETLSELETLKSEYAKVQQQHNALRARNKTLTSDVKSLRSQLSTVFKKTAESEKQIQAPSLTRGKGTSTTSSGRDETRLQEWGRERDVLQQTNHSLQTQLNKCLIELQSLRETMPETSSNVPPCSSSLEPYNAPKACTNSAKLSLPPLVPPPSGGNRKPHRPPTRTLIRKSLSAGQPSTQLLNIDLIEAQTIAQVSQVERDRLLELTGTLQQRLDATTDRLVRLETKVRNQRQNDVKPEKLLHSGLSSCKHHGGSKLETEVARKPSAMEVESKLALQLNENAVLKETLQLTRDERMEDVMLFHGMLQEAEQLFVDSLQKLRSE